MQARQGDILLERVSDDEIDTELEDRGTRVVLEGEATGHAHRLTDGTTLEPADQNGESVEELDLFVEVPEDGAELTHEEHHTIELEPGTYRVQRQRTWDPNTRGTRRVLD